MEMRAHSEMTVGRASDGIQIDLKNGDIIVTAAEQHDGHLYVQTKDMTVAVVGTVFFVNAGQDGSRVGVIEGEVRVREGRRETRLRPGEQVATSPTVVTRPLTEEINWSKNATAHRAHPRLESNRADGGGSCADCASRTGRCGQPGGEDGVRGGLYSTSAIRTPSLPAAGAVAVRTCSG